ncbi:hypothetical protein GALL_364320 [mine drainage metagenome]|uniref:Uncharacterized protein n=1 Tax=mine drainage metagenome TaxID=410659 RepID=A0A1J5QEB9_9ZZZZ
MDTSHAVADEPADIDVPRDAAGGITVIDGTPTAHAGQPADIVLTGNAAPRYADIAHGAPPYIAEQAHVVRRRAIDDEPADGMAEAIELTLE